MPPKWRPAQAPDSDRPPSPALGEVCTSTCSRVVARSYAFLWPDVYLGQNVILASGLPFPRVRDIVTFHKEPFQSGANRWRVTKLLAVRSPTDHGTDIGPEAGPAHTAAANQSGPALAPGSSPASLFSLKCSLAAVIQDLAGQQVTLPWLLAQWREREPSALKALSHHGYPQDGERSFLDFVELTLNSFPRKLSGLRVEERNATIWLVRTIAATEKHIDQPPTPGDSSPSASASASESFVSTTDQIAADPSEAEPPPESPPPSQLLVKLVGPEAASWLGQRTDEPSEPTLDQVVSVASNTPTAVELSACHRAASVLDDDGFPSIEKAVPLAAPTPIPTPTSDNTDGNELQEVHQVLRDLVLGYPASAFPITLKPLALQLRQRLPTVQATLRAHGFPATFRGFGDLVQRMIDRYPTEMADVELQVGPDANAVVARRSGVRETPAPPPDGPLVGAVEPPPQTSDACPAAAPEAQKECLKKGFCCVKSSVDLADVQSALDSYCKDCLSGSEKPAFRCMALDFRSAAGALCWVLVATPLLTIAVDVARVGHTAVCVALRPFLECGTLHKVVHNVYEDLPAFQQLDIRPIGLLDTQLAYEQATGELAATVGDVLPRFGPGLAAGVCDDTKAECLVDEENNQPPEEGEEMAKEVTALLECYPALVATLGAELDLVVRASDLRARFAAGHGVSRPVGFDLRRRFRLHSLELLQVLRPTDMLPPRPVTVDHSGVQGLLSLLPEPFAAAAAPLATVATSIILDVGRRPELLCGDRAVFLSEDEAVLVTPDHLDAVGFAAGAEAFSCDDRAALPGSLHRIGALRSRQGHITGLTLRVVRPVSGLAYTLSDVLLGCPQCSVLVCGDAASGKTAALRNMAGLLSQQHHIMVVDTYNEVGGDGDEPVPCLGRARRLPVPTLGAQWAEMEKCLQNHRPHVMVVDEIARQPEVEVALMARRRGVRLIAGVQGSLRQVVQDRALAALVGVAGDRAAQRAEPPPVGCVVELRRGELGEWIVTTNVAEAVDCILRGEPYPAWRRTREPLTGILRQEPITV